MLKSLFSDAVREVRKYSDKNLGKDTKLQQNMYDHMQMKLFRAQRNLYISGFAVFLWLWVPLCLCWLLRFFTFLNFLTIPLSFCRVMKRVVTLINQLASVSATTAALQAQADNANQVAKKYMEDNDLLKQVGLLRTASPKSDFSPVWMVATNYCKQTSGAATLLYCDGRAWIKLLRVISTDTTQWSLTVVCSPHTLAWAIWLTGSTWSQCHGKVCLQLYVSWVKIV